MTGYNDPVSYNANLTYSGEVPPVTADVATASVSTVEMTVEQHYLRSADVASASVSAMGATLTLAGASSVASVSTSTMTVTVSVGRAIDLVMAGVAAMTTEAARYRVKYADLDAANVGEATAALVYEGMLGAALASVSSVRAGIVRTRAVKILVTVAGTQVCVTPGSLSIEQSIGQRSSARMSVIDDAGALRFDRGQQVTIADRGTLLWSGYVSTSERIQPTVGEALVHRLDCIDQQYLADKRIAARTYVAGTTCGAVVADLHAQYLDAEGVTLGEIGDGATLEQGMLVNYQPVSGALDALADASDGYIWTIDQDRVLSFRHRSSSAAPAVINPSVTRDDPEPSLTSGNPDYRNTQWVLGGLAITDPQTETRTGDGDTQAWAMSYPLAKVPTVRLNGVLKVVGIKGLQDDSTYDFGWNKGDPVIAQASQTTKLTTSDTLTVTYQGQYAIVARVDDPTGIETVATIEGGSGVVEEAMSPGNVDSAEQAFALAQARLDSFDRSGAQLRFDTDLQGFAAGQWATVNLPSLGADGVQMLIESVRGQERRDDTFRWSVTAVDGPTTLPWQKVLGAPPELRKDDLVSVGSGTVVALVVSPRETAGWTEEIEESPMTCPLLPYTLPVILC